MDSERTRGFGATGQAVRFETAEFWTLRDGLLARDLVYLDMLAVARQIGAVPAAGSAGDRAGVWLQRLRTWASRGR